MEHFKHRKVDNGLQIYYLSSTLQDSTSYDIYIFIITLLQQLSV